MHSLQTAAERAMGPAHAMSKFMDSIAKSFPKDPMESLAAMQRLQPPGLSDLAALDKVAQVSSVARSPISSALHDLSDTLRAMSQSRGRAGWADQMASLAADGGHREVASGVALADALRQGARRQSPHEATVV